MPGPIGAGARERQAPVASQFRPVPAPAAVNGDKQSGMEHAAGGSLTHEGSGGAAASVAAETSTAAEAEGTAGGEKPPAPVTAAPASSSGMETDPGSLGQGADEGAAATFSDAAACKPTPQRLFDGAALKKLAELAANAQEQAQQQQHCQLQNHPTFKAMAETGVCVCKCGAGSCWCWQVHSYAKLTESCARAVLKTYELEWIFEDVRGEKVFHASAFSARCANTLREYFLAGYKGRVSFCERRSSHFDPGSGFSCPEHNQLSIDRSAFCIPSAAATQRCCKRLICALHYGQLTVQRISNITCRATSKLLRLKRSPEIKSRGCYCILETECMAIAAEMQAEKSGKSSESCIPAGLEEIANKVQNDLRQKFNPPMCSHTFAALPRSPFPFLSLTPTI